MTLEDRGPVAACMEECETPEGFPPASCCWTKPRTMRCGFARVRHASSMLAAHLR